MLACFDIGGTTVKCGFWDGKKIINHQKFDTPHSLEQLISSMKNVIDDKKIDGIALSCPGIVHKKLGIITGLSAVPYIHEIKLVEILENEFRKKVSIENDANCAALCESKYGVAKNFDTSAFIVIGTGIGGAFVIDNHILRGNNLLAGEYGLIESGNKPIGNYTLVHQARKYNRINHTNISGKELARSSDPEAQELINEFIKKMGLLIFNIQVTIDPEVNVIGGGVSQNIELIDKIKIHANSLLHARGYEDVEIEVNPSKYQNDANLIGAAISFN
ncbi:ROK family protein [Companilactobacillus sp. DQM5]|uniref:ROK family protein n=1 Tax=Companilactobacillus sp. DQM5 TaxID=3463359 RepID=UPI0040583CA3